MNKKFILIAGTITLTILTIGAFLLFEYANPWVEEKLSKQLDSLRESPINLTYKKLDVNILSGKATLDSVSITKKEGKNHYTFTFDQLKINGLGVVTYLINNQIELGKIKLDNPHLVFTRILDADSLNQEETSQSINLPDLLIKSFESNHGTFSIRNKKGDSSNQFITGKFDLSVRNLKADSAKKHEFKYVDLDKLDFGLSDIDIAFPDSLYTTSVKKVNFNLDTRSLQIDSISVKSRYDKYKLAHVVNHEIDWIDIGNPAIKISGIDIGLLLDHGMYYVEKATIEGFNAVIFRDKRLPFPQKPDTELLHQFIAKLGVKTAIDTVQLKRGRVEYQEFVKQGVGPGKVTFEELYASFYNFTNVDSIQKKSDYTAYMDARSMVMGKTLLEASFTFPLVDNGRQYTVNGKMKSADLATFNPMLEDVAFVRIEKGHMNDLEFEFKYNLEKSNGTMKFAYEDLKINTLDKESNRSKGLGENIKSFIANTFVVKTNNTKNDSFRIGSIEFKRNEKKSIFNYWWKSLLTGFRSSTGIKAPEETVDTN
ncbi:hypothetical protein GCM10009122_07640 [Fulvivirga kasyanovii]|uniref:DUF748 domain-containing protein n=1 Tax=Fulvivirga kasyanovii TaxID=396812 RepID=A0ABW9RYM1_9BACT|nr:hypothetical protein [Fulvivirga kasyanovii]MTI28900.1 hypothetical protein [Fulvivirga kasyanovii]